MKGELPPSFANAKPTSLAEGGKVSLALEGGRFVNRPYGVWYTLFYIVGTGVLDCPFRWKSNFYLERTPNGRPYGVGCVAVLLVGNPLRRGV